MRFIPTSVHGGMDYVLGLLLIAAPWLFGFADQTSAGTWVPVILGVGVIGYSLFTDYELGAMRLIPMPIHLWLDGLGGLLLLVSPWLFGFYDEVWVPHAVVGVLEIGAALTTHLHARTVQHRHGTTVTH